MDWQLWIGGGGALVSALIGYTLAIARDRRSAIHEKQIEALTRLHERVLEIERNELSDGRSMTLMITVDGGTKKQRTNPLSDDEVTRLAELEQWRQKLAEEEE